MGHCLPPIQLLNNHAQCFSSYHSFHFHFARVLIRQIDGLLLHASINLSCSI